MRAVYLLLATVAVSLFAPAALAIDPNDPNLRATAVTLYTSAFLDEPAGYGRDPNTGVKWATNYTIATHVPTVDIVLYPHEAGNYNWTHWGTGCVASSGKVYSAIGNYVNAGGNSYVYEYDPLSRELRCVGDCRSTEPNLSPTAYGPGKIHGRLEEGSDGAIYCSGFWEAEPASPYPGEKIYKYDPATGTMSNLGIPIANAGAASNRIYADGMLLYGEAKNMATQKMEFYAFDLKAGTTRFRDPNVHLGSTYGRDMFVDQQGRCYFNNGGKRLPNGVMSPDGAMQMYDPATNTVTDYSAQTPEKNIRRVTDADANGVMYGLTQITYKLFKFDPNAKTITTLTTLLNSPNATGGELADMTLDPTGRYIYYIPTKGNANGYSPGCPLIQVDLQTMNSQKIIAFLDDPIFDEFNVQLRGSWNVTISDDGRVVYAELTGHIGGMPDDPNTYWHDTAFAAIHIPDGEAVFVPEPVTMSLLALGGLALLRRRSGQVLRRRSRHNAASLIA